MQGSGFINRDVSESAQISEFNLDQPINSPLKSEYQQSKTLASIVERDDQYYIYHKASKLISNREKIWWVIKSFKQNKHGFKGHRLAKGDKVRFGR